MSDLVRNPEDWFSHNEAHIKSIVFLLKPSSDEHCGPCFPALQGGNSGIDGLIDVHAKKAESDRFDALSLCNYNHVVLMCTL